MLNLVATQTLMWLNGPTVSTVAEVSANLSNCRVMVSHTVDLEFPGLLDINSQLKSNSPAGSLITPGSITQHGIQLYQP